MTVLRSGMVGIDVHGFAFAQNHGVEPLWRHVESHRRFRAIDTLPGVNRISGNRWASSEP